MSIGIGIGIGPGFGSFAKPFVPTDISGIKLWLRADKGVTIGTGVSAWADQSGTGDANKNVTQATGSAQPTLNASDASYNGQKTLSLASASSQVLTSGTWAVALAQPYSIFVVGNTDNTGAAEGLVGCASPTIEFTTNNGGTGFDVYSGAFLNAGVGNSASPRVYGAAFSGTASTMYVSALTPKVTGAAGASSLASTIIGADPGPSHFLNGKIAEVVIYGSALTDPQIAKLFTYFGARYGITIGA